jgi:hypothetical protein
MTKYVLGNTCVLDTEYNRVIPKDLGNRHYQEYLAWVEAGNTPDPMTEMQKLMYD